VGGLDLLITVIHDEITLEALSPAGIIWMETIGLMFSELEPDVFLSRVPPELTIELQTENHRQVLRRGGLH
jgi:hypothetical protein